MVPKPAVSKPVVPKSVVTATQFEHEPVMVAETTEALAGAPNGTALDATVGAGGHAKALLQRCQDWKLIGLDADPSALDAAGSALDNFDDRVILRHARFEDATDVLNDLGVEQLCAAVFDLGVSSPQLDHPERGFSYHNDGPLDMRMDTTSNRPTAADLLNSLDAETLAQILRENSDERYAKRIAKAIVAARPLSSTAELAAVVAKAVGRSAGKQHLVRQHPARRTFQAIRIAVNSELEQLTDAISQVFDRLMSGGRLAVLSYHSGEDRQVKLLFRNLCGQQQTGRPGLPPPLEAPARARLLWRGVQTPTELELQQNRRASSARLRAVERLAEVAPFREAA